MLDVKMPKTIIIDGTECDVRTFFCYMGNAVAEITNATNTLSAKIGVEGYDAYEGQQHVGRLVGTDETDFADAAVKAIAEYLGIPARKVFTKRGEVAEPLERIGAVSTFPTVTHLDVLGADYDEI